MALSVCWWYFILPSLFLTLFDICPSIRVTFSGMVTESDIRQTDTQTSSSDFTTTFCVYRHRLFELYVWVNYYYYYYYNISSSILLLMLLQSITQINEPNQKILCNTNKSNSYHSFCVFMYIYIKYGARHHH